MPTKNTKIQKIKRSIVIFKYNPYSFLYLFLIIKKDLSC